VPTTRTPRYGRFIGTGAVLGVLIALVLATVQGGTEQYSAAAAFGYLALLLGPIGGLLGGAVAVLLERPRRRGPID
jgi:hypothetical protein